MKIKKKKTNSLRTRPLTTKWNNTSSITILKSRSLGATTIQPGTIITSYGISNDMDKTNNKNKS